MLRFIFKNFDQFLESLRMKFLHLFFKRDRGIEKRGQISATDVLEQEIEKQKLNLKEKEDYNNKLFIYKKIIYLKLKLLSLNSGNRYVKRAMDLLQEGVDESAYEVLYYLRRVPKTLEKEEQVEINICKALIYELREDFEAASKCYKEALKLDKSAQTIIEYREYVERYRDFLSWQNKGKRKLLENSYNIHNITPIEKLPEVAKSLESLAKYYARSPKSRSLGKSYYKEVLKIYKKLMQKKPKEFTCAYIDSLLEGVETFMMSPLLLKEAQDLLIEGKDCIEMRVYLLDRIKELKSKSFIQKSLQFKD